MNSFKEYYNDKEEQQLDEEMINEDAVSVVMAVLAFPSIVALVAWAGSLIFTSYMRGVGFLAGKVITMWQNAFRDIKDYITPQSMQNAIKNMKKDPKAQNEARKSERNKRAFSDELKEVYSAIEKQDFEKAKEEFANTPKYIQNNPDVHKVIIAEISKTLKEPPIYVTSPGNKTYQAIKKVINIRVAKAAAYATKLTMERNLKKAPAEQPTEEPAEEPDQQEKEDLTV